MVDPIVAHWLDTGGPVDGTGVPHEVKAHILRTTAAKHKLNTLVETGTGFGAMLALVLDDFEVIHSVEMQPAFHASSKERFRNNKHVKLYLGDSGEFVSGILAALDNQPAIWFLDAHYAGEGTARGELDTPVVAELLAIMRDTAKHVIVIDDARLFGKEKDYPTIESVFELATTHGYMGEIWGDEIILSV